MKFKIYIFRRKYFLTNLETCKLTTYTHFQIPISMLDYDGRTIGFVARKRIVLVPDRLNIITSCDCAPPCHPNSQSPSSHTSENTLTYRSSTRSGSMN